MHKNRKYLKTNKQTNKHVTRPFELAVDDELAVDEVVQVEVADDIQRVREAILVCVLCTDAGRVYVGRT